MNRTALVRAAGGTLLALAVLPVVAAASAHAAAAPTPYADQVAVGPAVKLAGPSVHRAVVVAVAAATTTTSSATASTASTTPSADDSTPPGGVVIATESHQPAGVDTHVAVLGTKVKGPSQLASTGPKHVGDEAALAALLIVVGTALTGGPRVLDSARRAATRRH